MQPGGPGAQARRIAKAAARQMPAMQLKILHVGQPFHYALTCNEVFASAFPARVWIVTI
jgi:hypothetical protein